LKQIVVAYSGGVDSSFLLKVAYDVLGNKVTAITIISPFFPSIEKERIKTLTKRLGINIFRNLERMTFELAYQESKKFKLDVSFSEFAKATRDAMLSVVRCLEMPEQLTAFKQACIANAQGVLLASGITKAEDPEKVLRELVSSIL